MPRQIDMIDDSGIDQQEFYPIIDRVEIQRDRSRDKLFGVIKFRNERYIGPEFENGSRQFIDSWKQLIRYNPEFIYGTSDHMMNRFNSVSVLEFVNNRQLHLVNENKDSCNFSQLGPKTKYFQINVGPYDDVRLEITEEDQDKSDNTVRFLVGKMDRMRRRFAYVRHQVSNKKSDVVQIGSGESLVLIESQKERRFKLSSIFFDQTSWVAETQSKHSQIIYQPSTRYLTKQKYGKISSCRTEMR